MTTTTHPIRRAPATFLLVAAVAMGGALFAHPGDVAAQASQLTPLGTHMAGLSAWDDDSEPVSITDVFPSGIKLGGSTYTSLHIGTNGYITLGHANDSYTAAGIAGYSLGPIVAPQFDDLDPSKGGDIYYHQNAGAGYVVVTWDKVVAYQAPPNASGPNSFQVVLRAAPDRDATDFDLEIRYNSLNWARSGNTSAWPTAGWSAGDQAVYAELAESGLSTFQDVQFGSNVGSTGIYGWEVEDGVVQAPPTVKSTSPATSITGSSAQSGGNVGSDAGLAVTERGLAYGTSTGPTTSDNTVTSGTGTGSFTATMTDLEPNTTYYVRAYASNSAGTGYGGQVSFTTPRLPQTITFGALEERTYGDEPVKLGATASSSLPVGYTSDNSAVATIDHGSVTIVGAGTATITATQGGNDSYLAADPVERTLTVVPKPIQGTFAVPSEKVYDAYEDTDVTERGLLGIEPSDQGDVELVGGTASYETFIVGEDHLVTLTGAELSGSRAAHYDLAGVQATTADIVPGPSDHLTIDGPSTVAAGEASAPFTLTIRDAYGNPAELDGDAVIDLTTDASTHTAGEFFPSRMLELSAGTMEASFRYEHPIAGSHRIRATHRSGGALRPGVHDWHQITVSGGSVHTFRIEPAGPGAIDHVIVGEPLALRIVAVDAHGNPAPDFEVSVTITADGALGTGGGATAAFAGGSLASHEVRFDQPGDLTLTIHGPEGTAPVTVPVRVLEPQPIVDVQIQADDWTPAIGQLVTLEVTATNRGAFTAHEVEVGNPLHGQDRLQAEDVTVDQGALDDEAGTWVVGELERGASATMRIRARVVVPE